MEKMYYFDNNATTQLSPAVSRMISKVNFYNYGNPSSIYTVGVEAKEIIEKSRQKLANIFNGKAENIIFTSGATESNNAVFHSALLQNQDRKEIIISAVEHPSVHNCAEYYRRLGYKVLWVPVTESQINIEYIKEYLSDKTAIISIMSVNNETGMIFPVEKIFQLVKEYDSRIICHSDCVQAVGKTDIPVKNADYLTISGHKFHGPKGIGCIYKSDDMKFQPFIWGGGQESGYRAGTENVAGIAGIGVAAEDVMKLLEKKDRLKVYQEKLEEVLRDLGGYIVCKNAVRVPGVTNVGFESIEANKLLLKLNKRRIFVSTGSACSSNSIGISRVIKVLGVPAKYQSTIRISMSQYTLESDVDYLIEQIADIVKTL